MSELILRRTIMLDSGEIIMAGTILKDYGEVTPMSVAPSCKETFEQLTKTQRKSFFRKKDCDRTVYFFRIPRECVAETSIEGSLKKKWVDGDEKVAPFPCYIKVKHMAEERKIEEVEAEAKKVGYRFIPHYFDKNFEQINVITISSLANLLIGSLSKFSELKAVQNLRGKHNTISTCIVYYHSLTNRINVDLIGRKNFYVEIPAYQYEIKFEKLKPLENVRCFVQTEGKGTYKAHMTVLDKGDNDWYKQFLKTHFWLEDDKYQQKEGDLHVFVRLLNFREKFSRLAILHKSTNQFLFIKRNFHFSLIKENPSWI